MNSKPFVPGVTGVSPSTGMFASLALTCFVWIPATVQAQDKAGEALEEIIVTAQKREENLQTAPLSIAVLNAQALGDRRIFTVQDLAANAPSFSLTANAGLDLELNIRGITNTRLDSPTADPSVGLFVDGIYIGRMGDMNSEFFDVERVEIIRGPQGVLLGKNVVGGALSVVSKRPEFENSGEILVSGGNYNSVLVNGYLTGGLSESVAGRLSFQSRTHDGYAHDVLNDRQLENLTSRQVRGQLSFEPADSSFSAHWMLDYNQDWNDGNNVVAIPTSPTAGARPFSLLRAFIGLKDPRASVPVAIRFAGEDHFRNQHMEREGWGTMLNMQWAFEGSTLTSITGYRSAETYQFYDQLGAGPRVLDELFDFSDFVAFAASHGSPSAGALLATSSVREEAEIRQFSQEIRLTSKGGSNWDWIVGGYYKHDSIDKLDRFFGENRLGAIPVLSGESHWYNDGTMKSMAGFAQLGYQLTDAWKLTIGGRYTKDEKSGDVTGIAIATGDRYTPTDTVPESPLQGNYSAGYGKSWSKATFQSILAYQPSNQWYFYGSVSSGFKGGGFEDTPPNAIAARFAFDPETVINYELGFKSTLMEGRMRLNASAFFMDYEDLQVSQAFGAPCFCNITDNASQAEIRGLEADLQWAIVHGLVLTASGSMLDAKYIDFRESQGTLSSGNKLQRTPDNQLSLGFNWSFGAGQAADSFVLSMNYNWQSDFYWQPANIYKESSYGLLDARLSYAPSGKAWSASTWVRNAGDKLYRVGVFDSFGDEFSQFGEPRTYGLDFRVRF